MGTERDDKPALVKARPKVIANPERLDFIEALELFQGKQALQIKHQGVCYTLRITSNNKLILTK